MVRRAIGRLVERHSSITSASGAANAPIKSLNGPAGSTAVTPSSRRPTVENLHDTRDVDHEQPGRQAVDDLLAQPLGCFRPRVGLAGLLSNPFHGFAERLGQENGLVARFLGAVAHSSRGYAEPESREEQHRSQGGGQEHKDQKERVRLHLELGTLATVGAPRDYAGLVE